MNESPSTIAPHKKRGLRFYRRYQSVLCFAAVLAVAGTIVLRQFMANDSAHVKLREDFLLLHDRGEAQACDALYQRLIQGLAELDEKSVADDLLRTSLLVDPKVPDKNNLVWRYCISVKKELERRSEKRLARVLEHEEKQ